MERKLLSLPSFFVLLLVAGIAFLATPVEDVHAAPELASSGALTRVTLTPTGVDADNALDAGGDTNLIIIKFQAAVKVAGTDAQKFDSKDVSVVVTNTSANTDLAASSTLGSAAFTVTPIATTAAAPLPAAPTANTWFVVNAAVPANGTGTITVSVLGSGATGAFQDAADNSAWATATSTAAPVMHYDTYDGDAPGVLITAGEGATGTTTTDPADSVITITGDTGDNDVFQLKVAFTDTKFAASQTLVMSEVSVATTKPEPAEGATEGSRVAGVWADPATTASETAATYIVAINPADGAMEVEITVAANAFTDASTNGNAETKKKVTINARPTVMIALATPAVTQPVVATVAELDVVLTLSAVPATGTGPTAFVESDITVTNGELKEGSLKRNLAVAAVTYTAKVTLPAANARKTPVTVSVAANAYEAAAATGIGNTESNMLSVTVVVPTEPTGPTEPTAEDTGDGDPLSGMRGFSIEVTVPANGWVVLAKNPDNTGISGVTPIDIDDNLWVDLSDFLATGSGGAISLVSVGKRVKDLVISELMWGNDSGKSPPDSSQWIELYNTTRTAITALTVELQFEDGGTGKTVPAVPTDSVGPVTTASQAIDKLTNWGQGNQYWQIVDQDGGSYGQGGKTTPNSPTSLGNPRQLVSMERKIDYVKVEKNNHDANNANKNRNVQLSGVPDGSSSGSWQASKAPRRNMSGLRLGTPGTKQVVQITKTSITKAVVFNEIANRSEDKNDWIELYNPGNADVKINNWVLSKVTAVDKDDKLFKFESDEDIVVPSKGFLLVVNEDPSETSLSAGENVDNPNSKANNLPTKVYVDPGLKIPKEKYLLVLRTEEKLKSDEKIVEIGGHIGNLDLSEDVRATKLWPLKVWEAIRTDDLGENNDKTWVRDKGKNLDHADAWKSDGGVTGLGIDRAATSRHSGTPGFANDAIKDKVKDLKASDPVVISEIMFATGSSGRSLPQWIELFNPSQDQAVKLNGWKLEVRNTNDAEEDLIAELNYTLTLPDVRVLPKQTVLIVSSSVGEATRDRFPSDRIINLWSNRSFREITEVSGPRDHVLSSVGFYMKLSDPEKKVVDEIGNIDGGRRSDDTPNWTLPGGNLEEDGRSSMMRVAGSFGDGTERDAWISADATDFAGEVGRTDLYYGDEDDVGTPGYRAGGPLPVQLSSFYSKRNDAGAVIITWATASELDNAGFNILRSTSRSGEFTKINAQLIPGAGTTGEKSAYTWTDTSAKPNVLYFYQIEDVSLDGAHRTLRTTRLRGHVGAHGKLTTTWGDLKSRE